MHLSICIAGCAGCPECCLGAAVIFGIEWALDHGVYEADPNEASDMIKDFWGKTVINRLWNIQYFQMLDL